MTVIFTSSAITSFANDTLTFFLLTFDLNCSSYTRIQLVMSHPIGRIFIYEINNFLSRKDHFDSSGWPLFCVMIDPVIRPVGYLVALDAETVYGYCLGDEQYLQLNKMFESQFVHSPSCHLLIMNVFHTQK